MSTQATNMRLRITRAGITGSAGAAQYLNHATRFAPAAWGFSDGSVLVLRRELTWQGDSSYTPQQISRRRWAAYYPR